MGSGTISFRQIKKIAEKLYRLFPLTHLEHGFLRVRCEDCHHERLVAFSCKRRGICPSCGARRMAEGAALLVDDVLPHQPIPKALRGAGSPPVIAMDGV